MCLALSPAGPWTGKGGIGTVVAQGSLHLFIVITQKAVFFFQFVVFRFQDSCFLPQAGYFLPETGILFAQAFHFHSEDKACDFPAVFCVPLPWNPVFP